MFFRGVAAVVFSSVLYGFLPVFIKTAQDSGMNTETVVFFRFFFAALISGGLCLITRKSLRITVRQLVLLLFYGVLGFGLTAFLLAGSYRFMPVGLATMFHFCYPVFVALIMIALFREPLNVSRAAAIAAVLAGLALMARFKGALSPYGTVLALLSGVTYAVYVVAVKKSALANLSITANIFYVTLFSSAFFLLKAVLSHSFTPPSLNAGISVFIAGFLCTVVSLALLTWGIRTIGATRASVVNMIEPVTSIVAGAFIYGERLSFRMVCGCLLILLGTVIISLPERAAAAKSRKLPEKRV